MDLFASMACFIQDKVEPCNCNRNTPIMYYCPQETPCKTIGTGLQQQYFCPICINNHKTHEIILIVDEAKQYHQFISKLSTDIKHTEDSVFRIVDSYIDLIEMCSSKFYLFDGMKDIQKELNSLKALAQGIKQLQDQADNFLTQSDIVSLKQLYPLVKQSFEQKFNTLKYLEGINLETIWEAYKPLFLSEVEFDLSKCKPGCQQQYFQLKMRAQKERAEKLQRLIDLQEDKIAELCKRYDL